MKIIIIIASFCICANAQISGDYKLIGTNLYDFSKAVPIVGEVIKIYPKSVTVKITGVTHYEVVLPDWARTAGVPDGFGAYRLITGTEKTHEAKELETFQKINNLLPIARAIAALPVNRQAAAVSGADDSVQEFLQPITPVTYIQLLHSHQNVIGLISFLAVPAKWPGFWDCGEPFAGDLSGFKYIYRVLPNKTVADRQYSPEEKMEQKAKLIAHQLEQASNNVAVYQYGIGKRYLTGDGVLTNKALGNYWISLAASNSYPAAVKFISGNKDMEISKKVDF